MRFSGKIAVVTGGSSGIGLETVKQLSEEGARVYNLDLSASPFPSDFFIKCDVSNYVEVKNAVDKIYDMENAIHIAFANAGVNTIGNIEETSVNDFNRIMSINCGGVFFLLKAVLPIMKKQAEGNILLMGSEQSLIGMRLSAAYGMTKGAVAQLAKNAAIDYADSNIKVNCICPGGCDTPLGRRSINELKRKTKMTEKDIDEMFDRSIPLQRIATPDEIARVACFILSPENTFMTGALIPVDGRSG